MQLIDAGRPTGAPVDGSNLDSAASAGGEFHSDADNDLDKGGRATISPTI